MGSQVPGLSLGVAASEEDGLHHNAEGGQGALAWRRRASSGPGSFHISPVVACFYLHGQGHTEFRPPRYLPKGRGHLFQNHFTEGRDLIIRGLEHQLVVDLEQQAGAHLLLAHPTVHADHCQLHDVGGRALDGHVDGHPAQQIDAPRG